MRHTVMAVDDVQTNLDMLEGILEDTYDVILAESGADALIKLANGAAPDLILLDLSMPGMDGFELLEKIYQNDNYSMIPVIFVTGENDVYQEEKGLRLGAVDYIRKPYSPNIISAKIRNHIELKTYRDGLSKAVAARTKELEAKQNELFLTHRAVILGMSMLAESRDRVTGAHLIRIEQLARALTTKLTETHPHILSKEDAELITVYSPLHDLGKVGVSDAILKKAGKLTATEFEHMQRHTTEGGKLLRQISEFLPSELNKQDKGETGQNQLHIAIEISECHHERYDGTGYPKGLEGDQIPLSARIITIVDIYDALRSPRPYKDGFSHEQAIKIITKGDRRTLPSHFDPVILKAFTEIQHELCEIYDANPDPRF
ncbi:MAG: response regulator [Defluviitaleaceae bacterium]|nr:response regulator [Defluviitaleaceae bacterium]MCL2261883.1 response regulator [Defluviitaleaceae bacterium]